MVTQCGMSEKVGKVFIKDQREEGDAVRAAIDSEVNMYCVLLILIPVEC